LFKRLTESIKWAWCDTAAPHQRQLLEIVAASVGAVVCQLGAFGLIVGTAKALESGSWPIPLRLTDRQ
jgi:hypothetical protein